MRFVWIVCLLALTPASVSCQEYRAFWADGFSAGFRSAQETDTLLRRLREANCNGVWAQMRKRGDAQYKSTYDPWARENPDHWDALKYLLDNAHAGPQPIKVHAWLNTCAVGGDKDPGHILNRHPDYISLSDKGETYDNEARKIDPGSPGANDWTFRVYLDVMRHYDVDGIHFDFVRYGGSHWGYNPVSLAWFNALNNRIGAPAFDDPAYQQWRRDNVTNLVRKVYAHAKAVRPSVEVSAATITWGDGPADLEQWQRSSAYRTVYQDWRGWMEEGLLDINCPMMYFSNKAHRDYWLHWNEFAKDHKYNRQLVVGAGIWLNTIPATFEQIADVRKPSNNGKKADGVLLYSYGGTNTTQAGRAEEYNEEFYRALAKPSGAGEPPFARSAAAPPQASAQAIVKGFVLSDPWLAPIVGAEVTLSGPVSRTARTDITGFYAFVGLLPGRYTVHIARPGFPVATRQIRVSSGWQVHSFNALLAYGGKSRGEASDGWEVLRVEGPSALALRNPHTGKAQRVAIRPDFPLPFQPGDIVAVGKLPGLSQPSVRLTGMRAVSREQARGSGRH